MPRGRAVAILSMTLGLGLAPKRVLTVMGRRQGGDCTPLARESRVFCVIYYQEISLGYERCVLLSLNNYLIRVSLG